MFALLQTPHVEIARLPGLRIIRFKRLATDSHDPEIMHGTFQDSIAALEKVDRSQYGLLVDVRAAPFRGDPEFERAFALYSQRLFGGFARLVVLVRTSVGKLQSGRIARLAGIEAIIVEDEDEAMRYLSDLRAHAR
jgi:hypothetical protein